MKSPLKTNLTFLRLKARGFKHPRKKHQLNMLKRQNKDYHEEIIVDFYFKTHTVKNPRPEDVALLGTPKKGPNVCPQIAALMEYWRNGVMEELSAGVVG